MRFWLLLLCLLPAVIYAEDKDPRRPFQLPPGVNLDAPLTADAAAAIALANNSALEAELAALALLQADLTDARLRRNPSIQSLLPVGPKPFEFLLFWPIDDLWQRKKRVLAAEKNLAVVAAGLPQFNLNLIRDVRLAHADLWLAQSRRKTLFESAALRARIAQLVDKRRENGDASGLDVSLARADHQSAVELLQRAEGDIQIANARLNGLLGLRDAPRAFAAANPAPPAKLPAAKDLVDSAYSARPDLRAAELQIEANAYRAKWQRSRIFNLVLPMLSVKQTGTPLQTRAGPGLQMELPLFNRNQGQIARADAEVTQAAWRYAALRDRVELEVRDALARLEQANAAAHQLNIQVKPALEQSIEQTVTIYKNGDASYLNVLESTRVRFDVLLRELDAEAAVARAFAELERAVGKRP